MSDVLAYLSYLLHSSEFAMGMGIGGLLAVASLYAGERITDWRRSRREQRGTTHE